MKTPWTATFISTAEVAQALGISVSTVKRWVEDGILPAQKTAGGHRKLLLADVLEVARQNNLPIRDASQLGIVSAKKRRPEPKQLAEQLYEALLAGEPAPVRALLHGAYQSGLAIEILADHVIGPAMERIGHDWETEQIDVMHEHRATQLCHGALFELKAVLESRAWRDRPLAVGGAVEGDFSELPSLLAQMVLLDAGWNAVNLGPNTPLASFCRALVELGPRLMWISVSHLQDRDSILRGYRSLYAQAEQAGVPVVIGGRALEADVRSTIPYTAYGDGLTHLAAFARTLNPHPRRPRRGRPVGS
jgi:excisionase family DNA binding protein